MRKGLVVNLQRFSLHDGPGVRTTVFFKGCPLRCLWCHNPESQAFAPEIMIYPDRCAHCGRCEAVCASPGQCVGCGACAEVCAFEARELVGRAYTAEEIFRLALRDQGLYDQTGGGVTLSGGEVMAQDAAFLRELLTLFQSRGVSVAIDTCGYAPWEKFENILDLANLFLYDLKAWNPALHRRMTGVGNALIFENLEKLASAGANLNLRVPVVPGLNAEAVEMAALAEYAYVTCGPVLVNLLPYHRVGSDKAERLGRTQERFEAPTDERMARIQDIWRGAGFDRVEIGG